MVENGQGLLEASARRGLPGSYVDGGRHCADDCEDGCDQKPRQDSGIGALMALPRNGRRPSLRLFVGGDAMPESEMGQDNEFMIALWRGSGRIVDSDENIWRRFQQAGSQDSSIQAEST